MESLGISLVNKKKKRRLESAVVRGHHQKTSKGRKKGRELTEISDPRLMELDGVGNTEEPLDLGVEGDWQPLALKRLCETIFVLVPKGERPSEGARNRAAAAVCRIKNGLRGDDLCVHVGRLRQRDNGLASKKEKNEYNAGEGIFTVIIFFFFLFYLFRGLLDTMRIP